MQIKKLLCAITVLLFSLLSVNYAQEPGCKPQKSSLSKVISSQNSTKLNINNVSTNIYNNGDTDISSNGNSGFEFPIGSDKTLIFESGFLWGAIVDNEIRVGGSTYNQGLQPGRILEDGTAEDPAQARIYRVRRDYADNADFTAELNDGEGSVDEIFARYEEDWNSWPAEYGAPYEDVDGDGIYNPSVDIPGVPGADQTVWYVANDLDENITKNLYGSKPLGLEMQATFWAYNTAGPLGNTTFRKYKLINKSDVPFDSMFVSYWADSDVGSASNDYAGCDTTLNLMFAFNGQEYDDMYGSTTPAIGYALLQGPTVKGNSGDKAIFDGKELQGYKNLNMTSHYYFECGGPTFIDPDLADYQGSLDFYNIFNGNIGWSGEPVIDYVTQKPTMFTLSGNPVTQTGWYYGSNNYCGDVRNGMVSGSFDIAVGDTQEVVFAVTAAMGSNSLNSLTLLKSYIKIIEDKYNSGKEPIAVLDIPKPQVELEEIFNTNNIELSISYPDELTSYDKNGFRFQGVNVFQFASDMELTEAGKRVATFDIADGVTEIEGIVPNYDNGEVEISVQQFGSDSGLESILSLSTDAFTGEPFIKGKRYYFGISAYVYNPNKQLGENNFESKISMVTTDFHALLAGANYGDLVQISNQEINEDAGIEVFIADPSKLTGHDYEVSFSSVDFYLDMDGQWKPLNSAKGLHKDVSGSTLNGVALTSEHGGIDLKFTLDLVSSNGAYVDGISITLPVELNINSVSEIFTNMNVRIEPVIEGNTITWGENNLSGYGDFGGGEELIINVESFVPPVEISYVIYDDGYSMGNDEVINAEGTILFERIEFLTKNETGWNLTDVTTGTKLLELQELNKRGRVQDEEIIDGLQIKVTGTFDTPSGLSALRINNGDWLSYGHPGANYSIGDFRQFGGYSNATSRVVYGEGDEKYGTLDPTILTKDYEIRWTGEYEDVNASGVVRVKEGTGSIATIYKASSYSLADHPMNPSPGTDKPFTVRIPFEIWNVDDNQQVNLLIHDRLQEKNSNPFYAFNPYDRMYCQIVNTPYNETVNDPEDLVNVAPYMTWNLVFWHATGEKGDVIKLNYADPILLTDVFKFNTDNVIASEKIEQVIETYELGQNYPNPFNPVTTIRYSIPEANFVKLKVYDILGREVITLVNKEQVKGTYQVQFNAAKFSSGVYIYRIESGKFSQTKKMMLLK